MNFEEKLPPGWTVITGDEEIMFYYDPTIQELKECARWVGIKDYDNIEPLLKGVIGTMSGPIFIDSKSSSQTEHNEN